MLKAITVRDFKAISETRIEFDDVNLIVGSNNSGKSSVLQAIHFFTAAAQAAGPASVKNIYGAWASTTVAPGELFYAPAPDVTQLRHGSPMTQDRTMSLVYEVEDAEGTRECQVSIRRGKNANLSIQYTNKNIWAELVDDSQPYSMYVPGLAGVADEENFITARAVQRVATRGHGNAVLRNVLYQLHRDPQKFERFLAALATVYPGHVIDVSFDMDRDETVGVSVIVDGTKTPLSLAGTGILQATQVLAYMGLYSPRVLLLDEPDAHLHPSRQGALVDAVGDWARESGARIVIATHSRHLLMQQREDARLYWMGGGMLEPGTKSEVMKALLDMGALDSLDALGAGSIDAVVLTEDSTNKARRRPLMALLGASGFKPDRVSLLSYDGTGNFRAGFLAAQFVANHYPDIPVILHRDRDYAPDEEISRMAGEVEDAGVIPFFTEGTDIESYFLSAEHICEIENRISLDTAEALVQEALDETRDASMRKWASAQDSAQRSLPLRDKVNSHDLAVIRETAWAEDPHRFVQGKAASRILADKLGRVIGAHFDLFVASSRIEVGTLATARAATHSLDGAAA